MTKTEINDYLTTIYPKETWKESKEIFIILDPKNSEGEITLKQEEFPNLERVMVIPEINLISDWEITLANILGNPPPKGLKINHYHNVELLKYDFVEVIKAISEKHSNSREITKLNLSKCGIRAKLEGELNFITEFGDLEELEIELSCPPLEKHFTSNYITDLDLSGNKKLKKITLTNSPVELNLDIFEDLENLEELNIPGGNWVGSLESLKDLPLKKLDISNNSKLTDWEHLPATITNLNCKGTDFYDEIKPFAFDVGAWKLVNHPELVVEDPENLEGLIKELNGKLEKSHSTIKSLNKWGLTDDNLLSQIEILETESRKLLK